MRGYLALVVSFIKLYCVDIEILKIKTVSGKYKITRHSI